MVLSPLPGQMNTQLAACFLLSAVVTGGGSNLGQLNTSLNPHINTKMGRIIHCSDLVLRINESHEQVRKKLKQTLIYEHLKYL